MIFMHLILALLLLSNAPATDCRTIADHDKRSFDNLSPITFDVDGDGKPDTIIPRTYVVRNNQQSKETHWITFDLKTSQGYVLKSFFRYKYGTSRADYWVYALVPCNANKDGRINLVFYAGDDTSDETIVLLNQGESFGVRSRKRTTSAHADFMQHRQPSPPSHYEDFGACPFECCTYRRWTVNAETVFYQGRSPNSHVIFRAKKGEHVTGLTGVVITLQPGKALVKKATTLGRAPHQVQLKPGDVLYVLHYLGEGYYKFWFRGRIYEDELPSVNDRLSPAEQARQAIQPLSDPQTVWWVKVKNKRGRVGWSKQDDHFDDMDSCA